MLKYLWRKGKPKYICSILLFSSIRFILYQLHIPPRSKQNIKKYKGKLSGSDWLDLILHPTKYTLWKRQHELIYQQRHHNQLQLFIQPFPIKLGGLRNSLTLQTIYHQTEHSHPQIRPTKESTLRISNHTKSLNINFIYVLLCILGVTFTSQKYQ